MATLARKISPTLSLADESIDLNSKQSSLLFLAGPGIISYALLDTEKNRFSALESYQLQNVFSPDALAESLESIISNHAYLGKSFASVRFAYETPRATLVPEALFEQDNILSYIQFNHTPEPGELVMADTLNNIEARNIFLLPSVIEKTVLNRYPNAGFRHHASALIESLVMKYKNESKPKLIVHIAQNHFEVLLIEGKKLRFYNSFKHQTSEDFIYYVLFVCEQLKLNPETIELILIGEVESNSAIYSILQKYVRNIRFGERPEAFHYAHPLQTIPPHFYCNLFSQQLIG